MESYLFPLKNAKFEIYTKDNNNLEFLNWKVITVNPDHLKIGQGYKSKASLCLESNEELEVPNKAITTINIPEKYQRNINISVSAWVWSDKPLSTFIKIMSNTGKSAISAPHTGNGSWEYLTVVYPFCESVNILKICFINKYGKSKIDNIQPVFIRDDRFDNLLDCFIFKRFRERLTYKRNKRIRIIFVGNSTIWGEGAEKNATISYVLQSKLESMYPGIFEVMNFGICGWTLAGQILSIDKNFHLDDHFLQRENCNNVFELNITRSDGEPVNDYNERIKNAVTIKEVKPDIIVLCSLWNDAGAPLYSSRSFYKLLSDDNEAFFIKYYRNLFQYADNPNLKNEKQASSILEYLLKKDEEIKYPLPEKIVELDNEKYKKISEDSFRYFVVEFIRRSNKYGKIWLLNLPERGGPNVLKLIEKIPEFFGIPAESSRNETSQLWHYWWYKTGLIQKKVLSEISGEFKVPFIDTGAIFYNLYGYTSPSIYANLQMFNDHIHLTYRGNEFVADQIFMNMERIFDNIALKHLSQNPRLFLRARKMH